MERAETTEQLLRDIAGYDRNLARQYAEEAAAPAATCIPLSGGRCSCGASGIHTHMAITRGMERNAAITRRLLVERGRAALTVEVS